MSRARKGAVAQNGTAASTPVPECRDHGPGSTIPPDTRLSLENGLLHVELVREVPEAMKPRSIPIASSSKLLEVKPTKVAA